jgi:hypothetical protein
MPTVVTARWSTRSASSSLSCLGGQGTRDDEVHVVCSVYAAFIDQQVDAPCSFHRGASVACACGLATRGSASCAEDSAYLKAALDHTHPFNPPLLPLISPRRRHQHSLWCHCVLPPAPARQQVAAGWKNTPPPPSNGQRRQACSSPHTRNSALQLARAKPRLKSTQHRCAVCGTACPGRHSVRPPRRWGRPH